MIKNEISALKLKIQSGYGSKCDSCFETFEDAFLGLVDAYGYGFAAMKALDLIASMVDSYFDE